MKVAMDGRYVISSHWCRSTVVETQAPPWCCARPLATSPPMYLHPPPRWTWVSNHAEVLCPEGAGLRDKGRMALRVKVMARVGRRYEIRDRMCFGWSEIEFLNR